jgi:hypothetical protein
MGSISGAQDSRAVHSESQAAIVVSGLAARAVEATGQRQDDLRTLIAALRCLTGPFVSPSRAA